MNESRGEDDNPEVHPDLERRTALNGAVVLGTRALQLLITLASTMVLARLLRPSDFGLVAMAAVLFGVAHTINNLGLSLAVTQRENIEHEELSSLFWVSLAFTATIALVTVGLAPVVAWFFQEPILIAITACMALGIFVSGFVNIKIGILRREMRFGALSTAEIIGSLAGAAGGVGLAFLGFGVWALVAQQLIWLCVQTLIIWNLTDWKPSPPSHMADSKPLRELLTYGGQTTLVRLLNEFAEQLDRILVGRLAGASALGLYQMAHRWSSLPALQLIVPMKSVAVSSFSRLQKDVDRYRAHARLLFSAVLSLALPALAFLAVDAPQVIRILLGPQWTEVVPLFRILAGAAFMGCASRIMIWVYLSEGRTGTRLRWTLLSRPITILFVLAGIPWGAMGIATGYALSLSLLALINVRYCLAESSLRQRDFYSAASRPACAALLAGAIVYLAGGSSLDPLHLGLNFLAYSFLYALVWLSLPGGLAHARDIHRWLRP